MPHDETPHDKLPAELPLREGIEVHHQKIDRDDVVQRHDAFVDAASSEQPAVDARVQSFDAAVHDFGKAGVLRHLGDGDALFNEQTGSAAGREQVDAATL